MFRRRTRISFVGLNLNRTLSYLSQKYTLYDLSRQGQNCQITVSSSVATPVVAYLEEKCYNITAVEKLGGSFAIAFLKKHFLIPVFFALAIAVIAFSSNFCWKIEVTGDYDSAEVLEALSQCNVRQGSNLFGFTADKLENALSNQLDAMYVVVNRKGSALYVNAVKKKQIDAPIDMHSRRDIVATAAGTVKRILCEQGTVLVSVGDVVKKGDLLIAGLRTYNDGTTEDVYALGQVILEQSCSSFAKFTGVATETVDTGNVFTANAVVLFGKSYGKLPPFETFRVESEETRLFPLNLAIERRTYYETKQVTKTVTMAECVEELKATALEGAMQKADFVVQYTQYSITDKGVTATVYGEVIN